MYLFEIHSKDPNQTRPYNIETISRSGELMCYQTHIILKFNKIHSLILINKDTSIGIVRSIIIVTIRNVYRV